VGRGHLGELGERDGGDLDVQVDAVEQGAGDATLRYFSTWGGVQLHARRGSER